MITKERLKELIEQGATIYSTGYREEVDLSLPCYIKDEYLVTDEGNGFEPTYLLENLTENVEEAMIDKRIEELKEAKQILVELYELCNYAVEQVEIYEKALELACDNLYEINFKIYNTEMNFVDYFIEKAKEELENE